ncbi:MAG: NAD-glutamate dehydrogenase domain-containing protein, partial [Nitrospinota bacterium]
GKISVTGIMIHAVDSPFLFENLGGYLNIAGLQILSVIHPVITVKRDNGKIVDIGAPEEEGPKEAFIKFNVKKVVNPENIKKLETEIRSIVNALYLSVGDFPAMIDETKKYSEELENDTAAPEDAAETAEFLRWLLPDNFILMGMVRYDVAENKKGGRLKPRDASQLGVYRNVELMDTVFPGLNDEIEKRILNTFERPFMMVIDFHTNSPSIIYHHEAVDVVFVRQYGASGIPEAVMVFIGRFARGGIMSRSSGIPFLRKKLDRLLESEKIIPKSHMHREVTTAFNQLPKRELFYTDRKTLSAVLNISASLKGDYESNIIVRHNPTFEYITVILIFSSRKYSQENLDKIKEYLCAELNLNILYDEASQSASVALAFFYFQAPDGSVLEIDAEKMVLDLRSILMTWDDLLVEKLVARLEDKFGFGLYKRYRKRLTDLYRQAVPPDEAVGDLIKLEELEKSKTLQLDITCKSPTTAHLRIYWNKELDLMKLIPTFKNLGLHVREEIALPLKTRNSDGLYIQLLLLEDTEERVALLEEYKGKLLEAIRLVISGETEDCELNRLVLSAGFDWRQIDMVRAYRNYMLQIDKSLNPASVTGAINKYTSLLTMLVKYFLEKFDPKKGKAEKREEIKAAYEKGLGEITDLTEDNIMRLLFSVVENTLRTNYFKPLEHHYMSFKINCEGIKSMPKPVPMAEIFVHSPFIDGLHMRGGKVARGGLRWSDRPDDFRTEILGLVKTQMVKNAVIVPAGSKGGFIIKKMRFGTLTDKAEIYKQLYQTLIRGLLDLTDNLVDGQPKPPKDIVCYDPPDPYLVVAADKGTATMSDSANEISEEYGFWLKDAFASGGAIGYDHKKYGITARGAWECVKRHFRELGIDIQSESITVTGIGDMAGDVFGNGMLLSEKIKLVASFNHMHIFLDPDPDPAKSFEERKRLFELGNVGRCQWTDYNSDVISPGGGVFLRSAKAIPISEKMQKLLGIEKDSMSGQELIRAILTMPVDLLYCGGIGTYIRSSRESDLDVGDKANDSVRVTADRVRARVIGEGANLALTQKARVEYAENGGINNTDAIDNAGGVNMSDHEVNIKIFLEILLARKELKSGKKRNEFFMNIGDEVAEMVLRDNYMQSSGITLDQNKSLTKLGVLCDYIGEMETRGIFERTEEDIPNGEELMEYAKKPGYMPRPIIAVLYGFEKIRLNAEIMTSKLVEYVFSERYFVGYFPSVIQRDYATHLGEHRLKKEIIATVLSNKIVNQAGVTFVYAAEKATGCKPAEICKAYLIVENLLQADEFRKMVHELDSKIPAEKQTGFL